MNRSRYWLTPPEIFQEFRDRYGELEDPYPYPRPKGYDALKVDWPMRCYLNPPFENVSAHIHKAAEQRDKGRFIAGIVPCSHVTALLLRYGAKLRYRDRVHWLDYETFEPWNNPGPILEFVLE